MDDQSVNATSATIYWVIDGRVVVEEAPLPTTPPAPNPPAPEPAPPATAGPGPEDFPNRCFDMIKKKSIPQKKAALIFSEELLIEASKIWHFLYYRAQGLNKSRGCDYMPAISQSGMTAAYLKLVRAGYKPIGFLKISRYPHDGDHYIPSTLQYLSLRQYVPGTPQEVNNFSKDIMLRQNIGLIDGHGLRIFMNHKKFDSYEALRGRADSPEFLNHFVGISYAAESGVGYEII